MTEPTYLSKSAFAARLGRSPSYITWLKDNNRLVLSPNGKQVDVHATEALIRDTADPSTGRAAGAEVLHEARVWPEYHPNYYGAFLRDPDGNNVEAVCHAPA